MVVKWLPYQAWLFTSLPLSCPGEEKEGGSQKQFFFLVWPYTRPWINFCCKEMLSGSGFWMSRVKGGNYWNCWVGWSWVMRHAPGPYFPSTSQRLTRLERMQDNQHLFSPGAFLAFSFLLKSSLKTSQRQACLPCATSESQGLAVVLKGKFLEWVCPTSELCTFGECV